MKIIKIGKIDIKLVNTWDGEEPPIKMVVSSWNSPHECVS